MAKGKYTPEIVGDILFAIAQTGRDGDGYTAGGIARWTFYAWIKKHPEFKEQVGSAKRTWRYKLFRDDPGIVQKARQRLIEHLDPFTETWKSVKCEPELVDVYNMEYPDLTLEEQIFSKLSLKVEKMVPVEETLKAVTRQASPWAVQMVLGKDNNYRPPPGDESPGGSGIETVDFKFEDV